MKQKIINPNLPNGRVCEVIIGEEYTETIEALEKIGIKCLKIACCTNVRVGLVCHADLQFCHVDEKTVFLSNGQYLLKNELILRGYNVLEIRDGLFKEYPGDVLLNAAVIGAQVICNVQTIDLNVLKYFEQKNYNIINVKQGYVKCSIAVVSNDAIITDDEAIGHRADKNGLDVLVVSKGSIKLENHNYGFIGGCCGLISKTCLAFNGNMEYHPDCNRIYDFTSKHHVEIMNLFDKPLTDIGSILPITECNE